MVGAVALVVALPVSAAGNAGSTEISTFDATGAVFTWPDASYTALGRSVLSVFHDSLAGNGSEHVTGTISPTGVTLTGGVVARVAGVEHAGSGGSNFSFAFGQCEAPQD